VVLVAPVVVAACSGSGGGFGDRANSVCAAANEQVAALGREPRILTADQADWLEQLTRIDRAALEELRGLEPPEDERADVAAMNASFGRGLGRADEIARASRAGDFATFRSEVDAALVDLRRGQALARKHGLDDCARLGRLDRGQGTT